MNKTLVPVIAVAMVLGAVVFGVAGVSAYGDSSERAAALAEKLGVDASQVETAFEELREENQAERQAEVNAQLQEAVTNGDLTQEQMDQILDKQAEMQVQREALRDQDLDRDEIRDQMHELRENFHDWLDENDIELRDIVDGPDKGHGFGGPGQHRKGF